MAVGIRILCLAKGPHLAREHTSEGIETALVLRRDELGDVEHERSVGVAVPDGRGIDVIQGPLIQVGHTVLLCLGWGWQMPNHHLQQSLEHRQVHP